VIAVIVIYLEWDERRNNIETSEEGTEEQLYRRKERGMRNLAQYVRRMRGDKRDRESECWDSGLLSTDHLTDNLYKYQTKTTPEKSEGR
jgi:hypothetical protein